MRRRRWVSSRWPDHHGHLTGDVKKDGLPFWIILSCALAIARHLHRWLAGHPHIGQGLVEIESPQGFAAEASSAAIILSSSAAGMPVDYHVATGSILGSGVGSRCRGALGGRRRMASRGWSRCLPPHSLARCRSGSRTPSRALPRS